MPIRRTRIRRLVAVVASLAASAGVLVAVQGSSLGAAAAPADTQLVSANPVNWTPKVLDGRVLAVKRIGNVVVVGGSFTQIQDVTSGAPIINRPYLFAFDAITGLILPNWNPAPDAQVDALVAAPGGNAIYVSGQ
jgi:hypothetical protein